MPFLWQSFDGSIVGNRASRRVPRLQKQNHDRIAYAKQTGDYAASFKVRAGNHRGRIGSTPCTDQRILTESANELIDAYKWAWHRGQAVLLCGSAILVFLGGLAFIFEQPRLRNIPGGIMMVVGSVVVFAGGVWIWRRRLR